MKNYATSTRNLLFKGEQGLLAVHRKHIFPIHHLGGCIHSLCQSGVLAREQFVGALDAEVAHGVGVLDHKGVHAAVLEPVHGGDVGVEADKEDAL